MLDIKSKLVFNSYISLKIDEDDGEAYLVIPMTEEDFLKLEDGALMEVQLTPHVWSQQELDEAADEAKKLAETLGVLRSK